MPKNTQPSLPGGSGGKKLPNPQAYGFTWNDLDKLLGTQQRIWRDSRQISGELVAAEEEIRSLEAREIEGMAGGILSGRSEDPDGKPPLKAKSEHEKLKKKSRAVQLALDKTNAEIYSLVAARREAWTSEIKEEKEQSYYRLLAAIERLKLCLGELAGLDALQRWLERPNRSFSPTSGPNEISTWAHGDLRMDQILEGLEKAGADLVEERSPLMAVAAPSEVAKFGPS